MKQSGNSKWLSLLLIAVMIVSFAGCSNQVESVSGSVDDPSTRRAELISPRSFKSTFYARSDVKDNSVVSGSADEERVALLASGIDGKAYVFNYFDATDEVDLEDMAKDDFIKEYRKKLNDSSTIYQYTKMELMDYGENYYKYLVKIRNKSTDEELSSETGNSEDELANTEKKPMVFFFVKKGMKTYEIIGLDMEAEDASAFTDSFQEILDEIVTIKTVSPKK